MNGDRFWTAPIKFNEYSFSFTPPALKFHFTYFSDLNQVRGMKDIGEITGKNKVSFS